MDGLTEVARQAFADTGTDWNGSHALNARIRQSGYGGLAGYEDVNDAVPTGIFQ